MYDEYTGVHYKSQNKDWNGVQILCRFVEHNVHTFGSTVHMYIVHKCALNLMSESAKIGLGPDACHQNN